MRKFNLLLMSLLILASVSVSAQTEEWTQDYSAALAEAKETGKPVLLNFSGSDWCKWCVKLDKEVFSKEAFKAYAEDNLVLVLVDTPARKKLKPAVAKQNDELKKKFAIRGFPTVLLVDGEGKVIAQTGYQYGGAEKYVEHLKELVKGS